MYDYLLSAISCVCIFHTALCDSEECDKGVLGKRETLYVPAGGSLSLSCEVQHCGDTWAGNWLWKNSTDEKFSTVKESARHHFTRVTLSDDKTQLVLKIPSVNQSDEGSYGCNVVWGGGDTEQGHWLYVNITTAVAVPAQRTVLHRVLVCGGAFLCLFIILGLARCLTSEVKPQPLPRAQFTNAAVYRDQPNPAPQAPPRRPVPQKRSASSHKAPPKSQQRTEVVYADISQDALRQQGATREPAQCTVYSSLKFP